MLHDARAVPSGTVLKSEVCIVGAGAAGITLARELAGQPFSVSLLESGGVRPDRRTQSLYAGENVGVPYQPLDRARSSVLGGTTDRWAGTCRPLDEIDFEGRPWVPHSGWPFSAGHLRSYYEQAHRVCQLGPFTYDTRAWEDERSSSALPLASGRVVTTIFQFSPPTRFGRAYRDDLARASNVAVYLHATAVELETDPLGAAVTRLRVACPRGGSFAVVSRLFVLAAGGIENVRLLLLSDATQPRGLGNQHDLVGRFFMEHPHPDGGVFVPSQPLPASVHATHVVRGTRIRRALTLAPEIVRREELLGCSLLLQPVLPGAVMAWRHLWGAARSRLLSDHDWQRVLDAGAIWRARFGRGFPVGGVGARRAHSRPLRLLARAEQAPNPESRVTLAAERDALGRRRARLDWRLSPIDTRSMRRALEITRQEIAHAGLGQVEITLKADESLRSEPLRGGAHHMGTTRMHDDPRHGVVDRHCRVHGVSNLYVAGSSVFPTVGYANPTLTIVAMTLRLADHLKALLG